MKLQNIEQVLEEQGTAFIQTVGVSMEPMLHERESTVVLEKPHSRLKRGDVALFKRQDGQYVLHRVIRVRETDYLIRGDNCVGHETVTDAMIVGVMKGYYESAEGAFIPRDDAKYQRYVHTVGFRSAMLRGRWYAGRVLRKLKKGICQKR